MNTDLERLLNETCVVTSEPNYDITTLWPERNNFIIRYPSKFWNGIIDLSNKDGSGLCLAESPKCISMQKLTMNVYSNENFVECNKIFINLIISLIQKEISAYHLSQEFTELIVSVTKTKNYKNPSGKNRVVTYEFYSNYFLCKASDMTKISNKIDKKLKKLKIKHKLPDILKDGKKATYSFIQNHGQARLIYGSSYSEKSPRFFYQGSYYHIEDYKNVKDVDKPDLKDVYHLINHPLFNNEVLTSDESDSDELNALLMFFFSNLYNTVDDVIPPKLVDQERRDKKRREVYKNMDKKAMTNIFINLIKNDRYLTKSYWVKIGMSLHKVYNGDDMGLKIWIESTKKAYDNLQCVTPEFIRSINKQDGVNEINTACSYLYDNWSDIRHTIKTLAWYAREDSPYEYEEWHNDWVNYLVEQSIKSTTDTTISRALVAKYWLEYIYTGGGTKGLWYKFSGHKWVYGERSLAKKIGSEFCSIYEKIHKERTKKYKAEENNDRKTELQIQIKALEKLIKGTLQKSGGQDAIIKQAKYNSWFKCVNFYEYLDTNPDIFGLNNGVFEVNEEGIIFRSGQPEDYISKSTSINYRKWYSWNDGQVINCMVYLRKVFPIKEELHLFLKYLSSMFRGENLDKLFTWLIGDGDNSKSMLMRLIQMAFGYQYVIKCSPEDLIQTKSGGGPSPEKARKRGARLTIYDELDDSYSLNKTLIKRELGRDRSYARNCGENGGEFDPTHKSMATSNVYPSISHPDANIEEKLLFFILRSKWTPAAPADITEQYKQNHFEVDTYFDRNLPFYAHALIWICAQYYRYYLIEGLVVPDSLSEACKTYWDNLDVYKKFIDRYIKEEKDKHNKPNTKIYIDRDIMYEYFTDWFKTSYSKRGVPNVDIFTNEVSRRWDVKPLNNRWYGVSIIEDPEDEEAEDVKAVNYNKKRSVLKRNTRKVEIPNIINNLPLVEKRMVGRILIG